MSNHSLSRRVLGLITTAPLAALLGCASRGGGAAPPASSRAAADSGTVGRTDGRSIEDLFAGRFPGVTATRVEGGGLQIRIRGGSNTFYGSNEPLYVVDDTPLPPGTGGVVHLNPNDIQRIEVLKNPSDTGIYGVRGANGVVKITTKRPGGR